MNRDRCSDSLIVVALALSFLTVPVAFGAVTLQPGQAAGSMTVGDKTIQLSHASTYATTYMDKHHVVLLLTDQALPASSWKDAADMMMYRMAGHKFGGVEFYIDDQRHVTMANYYAAEDSPIGGNIVFELKLDAGAGKTLTGSASSTPFAAKLDSPVKLEVRFNAPLP
jgi:hypothetical protein